MSALTELRSAWRTYAPATLLFTPGNESEKVAKLPRFAPDACVLDLEDAVAIDEKVAARPIARAGLLGLPDSMVRTVRVNNAETGLTEGDVDGVMCEALDGVVYPKVEHADELWDLDRWLTNAERDSGAEVGRTIVIALIETAYGMTHVGDILGRVPDRVLTIGFGVGDYTVDLGIELGDYGRHLDHPRSVLNVAARAHRLAPPVDGPWLPLHDLDGLRTDCVRSKAFGFGGRQLIYPSHVPVARSVFAGLDDERRAHLERVVEGFEAAEADGRAALQIDGRMVDYPIYHLARRELALAARAAADGGTPSTPHPTEV